MCDPVSLRPPTIGKIRLDGVQNPNAEGDCTDDDRAYALVVWKQARRSHGRSAG